MIFAGYKGANGNLVSIDHADGLRSHYAHLHRFAGGIKSGAEVRNRQVIGYVGSTGRSTGPHLHFGLKREGTFLNPLKYKVRPGRPVPEKYKSELKSVIARYSRLLDNTQILPPEAPVNAHQEDEEETMGMEEL